MSRNTDPLKREGERKLEEVDQEEELEEAGLVGRSRLEINVQESRNDRKLRTKRKEEDRYVLALVVSFIQNNNIKVSFLFFFNFPFVSIESPVSSCALD